MTQRLGRFTAMLAGGAAVVAMAAPSAQAQSRDQIRIVGSSTVYPFASYVAEEFGKTTKYPTPVIRSTGSGGGHKIWGQGVALSTPDLTNSSRKMKVSEFKRAQNNGVDSISEAVIGYDGIAFAQNAANDAVNLTREQITLAVAAKVPDPNGSGLIDNPHEDWSDIDSSLPDREITIYGPPTTSGTRDAFEELVMEHATEGMSGYDGAYTKIRQDGAYVPSGENDNLIVQKLNQNKFAFGIFGYSFLAENTDKIQGASIEGVAPKPEAISSGYYPISRSLFFYVKNGHRGKVAGMDEFLQLFMSEKMIGPYGYLKDIGLISLPDKMREASRQRVLEGSELKLKNNGKLTTLKDYMKGRE
jgi:phosphate transport system substrate-binding protein